MLLVEDDASILATLKYNLRTEGYEVLTATDGAEALALARSQSPAVIVLDLMLPVMSGTEICKALRREGDMVPILMLTARGETIDRIVGLELGADHYMTKPFEVREVLAQVAAMIRRVEAEASKADTSNVEQLQIDDLLINLAAREVTRAGELIYLRPKEFDLFAFLASNPGRAYSRDQILQQVWGYEYTGDTRTVDVHVRWLRQKIEDDASQPRYVLTIRGVGYRFASLK